MKKTLLAILASAIVGLVVYAAPVVLIGTLVTVNNTTSSSSTNAIIPYNPNLAVFNFTHGGLVNTNDAVLHVLITSDLTNWTTVASFKFPSTNAGSYSFYPTNFQFPIYMKVVATTTNSVQLGGTYGQ